jgi:hypothetical protein
VGKEILKMRLNNRKDKKFKVLRVVV